MTGPRRARLPASVLLLIALALIGCTGVATTPIPAGHPLNPCPMTGAGAVTPREGYRLVAPGEVAFAYEAWHNETPDSFACGAQSIKGGKTSITSADFPSGILPWVATFRRAVPLLAPEPVPPKARLLLLTASGAALVETIDLPPGQAQYGTLSNAFEGNLDPDPGLYRLDVVSASGEVLATGQFELLP
jgi:hypothetical protein